MSGSTLTLETLVAAKRLLESVRPRGEVPIRRIVVTSHAAERGERLFPASRNRSARVRKKLIKRFGGEYRMIPTAWRAGDTVMLHPALEGEWRRKFEVRTDANPWLPAVGQFSTGIEIHYAR